MNYVVIFVILLYVNITYISCKNSELILASDKGDILRDKYKSVKFSIKNPWTFLLLVHRDPICTFYIPSMEEICKQVKAKLQSANVKIYAVEGKFSYSGCYQFKINKTDRIQRVRACPFTTREGSHAFISYAFEGSNNYYVYEASKVSDNKSKFKVDKNAESADLVALVPIGESVWFYKELWKESVAWWNKNVKKNKSR